MEGITLSEIISVEHLAYTYPGVDDTPGVAVFEDMNLTVEQGSFVAILGTNGCGKSTLAKHFNSILLPTGGKVYVCGIDTSNEERVMSVRRNVGMVFQNPDNQIVANVVEEDVAFAPENLGVPSEEIRRRVDDALKSVGMTEFVTHAPHLLSGGQKQRIAIARIFLKNPPILILDEATSALDSVTEAKIQRAFDNLALGRTTLIIAHRLSTIRNADRIISIADGVITESGAHEELLKTDGIYAQLYKTQNALALEAMR